jgi:hypothetical protein
LMPGEEAATVIPGPRQRNPEPINVSGSEHGGTRPALFCNVSVYGFRALATLTPE